METLWKKEDIKLKIRYYLIPQALVSIFMSLYPFFMQPLFKKLYAFTGWDFFNHFSLPQVSVVTLITLILAYFSYAYTGIFLFNYLDKKWGQRFSAFILPIFVGCLMMAGVKMHIDHAKIRSYTISNIGELRNIHDSTEVYVIEYYHILYDEYFYTENIEDVNIGSSKNPYYVTQVNTFAVCPVLINFSTELDLTKQKVWIGFTISKRFQSRQDFNGPQVKEAAYENLIKLHAQNDIVYFTETENETYLDLVKEKLRNNSITCKDPIIHYQPYEPYDGYKYALVALYCFLGGSIFDYSYSYKIC